jgi:hypothetical protein
MTGCPVIYPITIMTANGTRLYTGLVFNLEDVAFEDLFPIATSGHREMQPLFGYKIFEVKTNLRLAIPAGTINPSNND